jgi:membrane protein
MRTRAFFSGLWREVNDDNITDVAAMMTYYAVFSLFPMLVFVVTVALLVLPPHVIDDTVALAAHAMPHPVVGLFTDQVTRMESAAGAGFAIGSAALALWGASRGAASLQTALNAMFDKKETRPWWRRQLIAIGTTLVVAALLVIAMALIAVGGSFDLGWPMTVARWALAALLVMLVWALLYKWLPDTDAPFRIFTPGAATGVILWFGVTQVFGLYLDRFASYEKTYGAVATVVVFLTWLWLSNLALLLGAEVNDVLADLRARVSPAAAKLAHDV